jgi:hypothetical protein
VRLVLVGKGVGEHAVAEPAALVSTRRVIAPGTLVGIEPASIRSTVLSARPTFFEVGKGGKSGIS